MSYKYHFVYLKTTDSPTFWFAYGDQRLKMNSVQDVHRTGLYPVLTVTQEELEALPVIERIQEAEGLPSIQHLKDKYKGKTLYVVGAGPSIQYLDKSYFKKAPVVALNYAIEIVEPLGLTGDLYSMQKDRCFVKPQGATLLVHSRESQHCFGDYEPQYSFDNQADFGMLWYRPSDATCVGLAELMGCKKIIYLCCDASAIKQVGSYRRGEIVMPSNADEILMHRSIIEQHAKDRNIEISFITPQEPEE